MELPSSHEVTRLLKAWSAGDEHALEKLTPLVYRQLHQIAQRYMGGERSGHMLQTHRTGERSLSTVSGLRKSQLAGPRAFLRYLGQFDAAYSD